MVSVNRFPSRNSRAWKPSTWGYLLKKYDLPPKYIKAEITESAYAEEDDTINSTVDRLREAGLLVMG